MSYLPTCFLITSPFSSNKPALVLSDRLHLRITSTRDFLDHIRVFRCSHLARARKNGLPKYTEYPRAHRRLASGWLFREYNHETKRLAAPLARGDRGEASQGTRKKREDEKEIERNALLRRGRRGSIQERFHRSAFCRVTESRSSSPLRVSSVVGVLACNGPYNVRYTCWDITVNVSAINFPVSDHK